MMVKCIKPNNVKCPIQITEEGVVYCGYQNTCMVLPGEVITREEAFAQGRLQDEVKYWKNKAIRQTVRKE